MRAQCSTAEHHKSTKISPNIDAGSSKNMFVKNKNTARLLLSAQKSSLERARCVL